MELDEQPQWFGYFPYKIIRSRGSLNVASVQHRDFQVVDAH